MDMAGWLPALAEWLPRQRWYHGQAAPASVEIVDQEIRGDRFPSLACWSTPTVRCTRS